MKYLIFLKERGFIAAIFGWLLFSIEVFLLTISGGEWLMLYVGISIIGAFFLLTFLEYRKIKRFYVEVTEIAEEMEEKYLVSELDLPVFNQEERLWKDFFHILCKSMKENVNKYERDMKDYKEYIELWIHEVKIPIASVSLMIENHRAQIPEGLESEMNKIQAYTEQALFYARSNDVEKDYFIKKLNLKEEVDEVLLRNRRELIRSKTVMNLHDLAYYIYSDGKWLNFILNQIIGNSIKYATNSLELEIYAVENTESIDLFVKDNGKGIKEEELGRIFDKGFTGSNGRDNKKATGIGLYLCKKLCNRLGLNIRAYSQYEKEFTVVITFPKSSMIEELR